ncbi:shikimate dehydrogenase [Algivirga pacifica]|uniref:Shikimate 5-dehydrogenase n=1 Tax=Algivirga pacifica TaxID=1162670 RepID=A0ABP9D0Y2_9BACT
MPTKETNTSVQLNLETKFIYSTSGSQSSIEKHNKALSELGVNVVYFTLYQDVTPEVYAGILRGPMVRGAAVTAKAGLKSSIIPYLDEVEPLASKTKTVNTVINKEGRLVGYNTDSYGLKIALEQGIQEADIPIKTAVIYGNGGVSGAAFHVLSDMGIEVTIVGRNPEKVAAKRKALGIDHIPHFEGPYDLVVDATPVSSDPDFLKAEGLKELLQGSKMVFCHNMPEKDGKTNYLQAYCEAEGKFFIPGNAMYKGQLIKQYQLFLQQEQKANGGEVSEEDIIKHWNL